MMRPSEADQKSLNLPEFVVFQVKITPTFEFEQTGSGFPCKTEAKANELVKMIEEKNNASPNVVLFSWEGGFALGTVSNMQATYEELVLYTFHKPQVHDGKLCGFSLRLYKMGLDNPPELVKEEMLPTTDLQEAQALFEAKDTKPKDQENKLSTIPSAPIPIAHQTALRESQFLVLSKLFPETIRLLKSHDPKNRQAAYEAYQRENFAITGKMDGHLSFNEEQFKATANALVNNNRRKNKGLDPIDVELVTGWFIRNYSGMTPEQRAIALKSRGLNPPSAEAIRKICTRLKLPAARKPGFH